MSDMPCPPMFATETMAELSARQGRVADALAIYRHLLRSAEADGDGGERVPRWKARLVELESGTDALKETSAPPPRETSAPPPRAAPPERAASARATSLVIREPVRSGQVIYADGRDLIVLAPVNPGAQLLADGNIHIYGPLAGRAVAGAQGQRDAQVFCLALQAELVGIDTGYVLSDDMPPALWSGPARVFLTPDGTCSIVALSPGKPGHDRWRGLSGPRTD